MISVAISALCGYTSVRWKLTLRVLMRTIDVVASHDHAWKFVGFLVSLDIHLGGGFAGGVRVGGFEQAVFFEIFPVVLTVDFISADMNELFDVALDSRLEQLMGTDDIRLGEGKRVAERQVDVRHGCEVHNGVNVVLLDTAQHGGLIVNVAKHKLEVGTRVQTFGIVQRSAVVDFVKRHNIVGLGIGEGEMADNPGGASGTLATMLILVRDTHMKPAPPVIMIL